MPIYMDSHIAPGFTARQVAEAHYKDALIQDDFQCNCMTYWYDESEGRVFCLIEAPDQDSVFNLHSKSHGLVPNEIIEVDESVVESFLGRIKDPQKTPGQALNIFTEKAFRILVSVSTDDVRLLRHRQGIEEANKRMSRLHEKAMTQAAADGGRRMEQKEGGKIFSFDSATQAYHFATTLCNEMRDDLEIMNLRICLEGGMPVDNSKDLFGETLATIHAMTWVNPGNVIVSQEIQSHISFLQPNQGTRCLSSSEQSFLKSLLANLELSWNDSALDVPTFCDMMSMSKPQLYRKCVAMTALSPNNLLRDYRLAEALKILKNGNRTVTETAFDSGFTSPSYFTKCFYQKYGIQPLTFLKTI